MRESASRSNIWSNSTAHIVCPGKRPEHIADDPLATRDERTQGRRIRERWRIETTGIQDRPAPPPSRTPVWARTWREYPRQYRRHSAKEEPASPDMAAAPSPWDASYAGSDSGYRGQRAQQHDWARSRPALAAWPATGPSPSNAKTTGISGSRYPYNLFTETEKKTNPNITTAASGRTRGIPQHIRRKDREQREPRIEQNQQDGQIEPRRLHMLQGCRTRTARTAAPERKL